MTCWTHPQTGTEHSIRLARCNALGNEELNACFRLIEQTSRDDYENSTAKWHAPKKLKEMRSPDLRYIVVEEAHTGTIRAFTSLMPTFEEGQPVIYCYEIHLAPELQGLASRPPPPSPVQPSAVMRSYPSLILTGAVGRTGLGSLLMSFHATVAANLPPVTKVMLTCFLSNQRALGFYRKLGFEKDAISPEPRTLRGGTTVAPDYVIMSKTVRSRVGDSAC